MKIIYEEPKDGEEDHIVVKCRTISSELQCKLNALRVADNFLIGTIDNKVFKIPSSDIFYIEAVDNKVFLYGEKKVWESKQRLYELDEMLATDGFLRVSKSFILNLRKVQSLSPALSGKLEANLPNDEKVIISRKYVGDLRQALGFRKGKERR